MNNYENQLDEVRVRLFEETDGMEKNEIVTLVNSHARKIAHEFGITMIKATQKESRPPTMANAL